MLENIKFLRHDGIRDFRASSLESSRKVRLFIKGEYFETNFFKIGHLFERTFYTEFFATRHPLRSQLSALDVGRDGTGGRDEEEKKSSSGKLKQAIQTLFVIVNKTNRQFEFANCQGRVYHVPRR